MKLFGRYLKYRIRLIVYFALLCIIFISSFVLYGLPVMAVIYPAALCTTL